MNSIVGIHRTGPKFLKIKGIYGKYKFELIDRTEKNWQLKKQNKTNLYLFLKTAIFVYLQTSKMFQTLTV